MTRTCPQCNEKYEGVFAEDFIKGVCLACDCYNFNKELDRKWAAEIAEYNKLTGKDLEDVGEFYHDCYAGNIKKSSVRGFPELSDIYDDAKFMRTERAQSDQLQLFNSSKLPF